MDAKRYTDEDREILVDALLREALRRQDWALVSTVVTLRKGEGDLHEAFTHIAHAILAQALDDYETDVAQTFDEGDAALYTGKSDAETADEFLWEVEYQTHAAAFMASGRELDIGVSASMDLNEAIQEDLRKDIHAAATRGIARARARLKK